MVFCGKPSKSCHACRARKTKCDALPHGCTQCQNAGRQCPGYRAQVDVIFREETTTVIKRAKAKHEKARQKAAPISTASSSSSSSSNSSLELAPTTPSQRISPSYLNITPSIEDRAAAFFVSNYVIGDSGPTRGHLDQLADLYESNGIDDNLVAAVHAVGLIGYSHSVKAPELLPKAQSQYTKALRLTNAALRCPTAVKKDSTLMAILILGIYEIFTGTDQKSMQAWAQHIHGAAAVVKLRGPDAIKTPGGIRLLAHVTSSMIISCIQRDIPLPKYIVEMQELAEQSLTRVDPSWRAQKAMIKFTKFNGRYHANLTTRTFSTQNLLSQALAIDGEFLDFFNHVPPGWEYKTVYTDQDPEIVYNGHYHIYYDHWIAQIWNAIRQLRILLNEIIHALITDDLASAQPSLRPHDPVAAFHLQNSFRNMHLMQAEILASVPQHVGYTVHPDTHSSSSSSQPWAHFRKDSGADCEFPVMRFSGGYFLLWPLYLAGNMPTATDEVRAYAVRNLRRIALVTGIRQAGLLAEVVEMKRHITVWGNGEIASAEEDFGG
ncbi:hypothetical protein CJF30_00000751 [Rutstroemia sp. NJR-2017a BBW]|nr:hypothetical protein CJF30_00000751 [Rutstroemia sp. NJR-2017a BBW]